MPEGTANIPEFPFPQELVDLIVDKTGDDPATLKTCCLLNRTFASRAQDLIFKNIRISGISVNTFNSKSNMPWDRCKQLRGILEHRPHLSRSVHSITLVDNLGENVGDAKSGGWLTKEGFVQDLVWILSALTSLNSITIQSYPSPRLLNWRSITQTLKDALRGLFAQPTVTDINLRGIILMDMFPFGQCHHLKNLTLYYVTDFDSESQITEFRSRPQQQLKGSLRSLTLADCGTALDALIRYLDHPESSLDISHLQQLTLHCDYFTAESMTSAWHKLLDRTAESVEEYQIIQNVQGHALTSFSLGRFPRLRVLRVILFGEYISESLFTTLLEALHDLSSNDNRLQRLCISIVFKSFPASHFSATMSQRSYQTAVAEVTQNDSWGQLDSVLSRQAFNHLKSVDLYFRLHPQVLDVEKTMNKVRRNMPILSHLMEILHVNWFQDSEFGSGA